MRDGVLKNTRMRSQQRGGSGDLRAVGTPLWLEEQMSKRRGTEDDEDERAPSLGEDGEIEANKRRAIQDEEHGERDDFPSRRREIKQTEEGDEIHLRVLVSGKEAVMVIGRHGSTIAKIRHACGVQLNVSEHVSNGPDRVVHVHGTAENVAKAAGLIVRTFFGENFEEASSPGSQPYQMRILMPDPIMGALIGRRGKRFREIEEQSAAQIKAFDRKLPYSDDRYVVVFGVADAIHIAVYYLAAAYLDHRDMLGTWELQQYDPAYMVHKGLRRPMHHFPDYFGTESRRPRPASDRDWERDDRESRRTPRTPPHLGESEAAVATLYYAQNEAQNATPGQEISQQIRIPDEYIGPIIGKGGQKLRELRRYSGSRIAVEPDVDADRTRLLTISGTPDCNRSAIYLLHTKIKREKNKGESRPADSPPLPPPIQDEPEPKTEQQPEIKAEIEPNAEPVP